MTRHVRFMCAALCLLVVLNTSSYAWNAVGHMAVAFSAYQQLTPRTKARVDALLALNPDRPNWLRLIPRGTSPADRKMMIFMIAATWPDRIKSDPTFTDDTCPDPKKKPCTPDRPDGKRSNTQNIGYSDHFKHKYWHFVDTPFSQDGTALEPIPNPNAQTQIDAFRAALASNRPNALKSYDLCWIEHLVGDVHQPLHATARFSSGLPHGDAGGNSVKLCSLPCKDNLHGFWDDLLGTGNQPAAAITAGRNLPTPEPGKASDLTTADWIKESFDAAKRDVYMSPSIGAGAGPFTLTAKYKTDAKKLAQERVALAGARLAKILNEELK